MNLQKKWNAQLSKIKKGDKRLLVRDMLHEMARLKLGKRDLARKLKTSRAQLDRILSPTESVSLQALEKTARALGCRVVMKLVKK